MTKKILCLNFWKMWVPLTSSGNPGIGRIIFKPESRNASFEMPLVHSSGDFFMPLECGVCLSGEGLGTEANIWETSD